MSFQSNSLNRTALPVALKVYACLKGVESEFQIYEHIRHVRSRSFHLGACSIRGALDMLLLPGDGVHHWCLVQPPLLQNLNELQLGMASGRVDPRLCRYILKQVLSGLDFLHRKCRVIHTGEFACRKKKKERKKNIKIPRS